MAQSLATKYRPKTWEEVIGQDIIVEILKRQIELGEIKNCMLFCGASGDGKTTCARLYANSVNGGVGNPIEIDAASNNGVDNVRDIIAQAKERALDCKYKVFVIDECVTGDTEILTNMGWKRFDALNGDELIAQYNNGNIEFVKPIEFIEMDYSGDMYNVGIGNKASFIMSPNHVQPLYYDKSKRVRESYIKETNFNQSNRFIRSGNGVGELQHLSTMDRIAIMLQADGCLQGCTKEYNYWTIQLKKVDKKNRMEKLLGDCSMEYRRIKPSRNDCIRYSIKTPLEITKKLSTHFDLHKMSAIYAREFIEELMLWDGHIDKDKGKYLYYSCVDRDNVDFCQCVGILGGYKSRVGHQDDNRSEKHRTIYRLYLQEGNFSSTNQYISKEVINFDGKIYCVKVPSHMILIRKDGYELVTGNCHSLSNQAWQAFLKCIEEPPKYTIFIFCTTDPQKIPETILNRVQRYNFSRISTRKIQDRLEYVCRQEGFVNYKDSIEYIAKLSNGCMRMGLSLLDKCVSLSNDLSIQNVLSTLGNCSYDTLFELSNAIIDDKEKDISRILYEYYNSGADIKLFVEKLLEFFLDLEKYCLFSSMDLLTIPSYYEDYIKHTIEFPNAQKFFAKAIDKLFELKNMIKNDNNPRITIEIILLQIAREA